MKLTDQRTKYIEESITTLHEIFGKYGITLYGIEPTPRELISQKVYELVKRISPKMNDGDWSSSADIIVMKELGSPIGFSIAYRLNQINGNKPMEEKH